MKARVTTVVEFLDRRSCYWEVIPLPLHPGTVLKRVQAVLAAAEVPDLRRYQIEASIGKESLVLRFDVGDADDAERFATLLAMSLGWRPEHGAIVGRAE